MSVQAIVQGAQFGLAMYLVGGAGRAPYVVGVSAAGGPKGGGVTSYSTRAALLLAKRIVAGKEQDTSKEYLTSLSTRSLCDKNPCCRV